MYVKWTKNTFVWRHEIVTSLWRHKSALWRHGRSVEGSWHPLNSRWTRRITQGWQVIVSWGSGSRRGWWRRGVRTAEPRTSIRVRCYERILNFMTASKSSRAAFMFLCKCGVVSVCDLCIPPISHYRACLIANSPISQSINQSINQSIKRERIQVA